jgi:hypothetical protein
MIVLQQVIWNTEINPNGMIFNTSYADDVLIPGWLVRATEKVVTQHKQQHYALDLYTHTHTHTHIYIYMECAFRYFFSATLNFVFSFLRFVILRGKLLKILIPE